MIYDIKSKSDLLTGASLTVTVPEEDLDRKALYTIQADRPGFLLPFRYKNVDGQIELIYNVGSYCKLQYLAGSRSVKEYADLWTHVLGPLLDCRDWFLKPYSLVLNSGYVYCDKNGGKVYYIYIPSVPDCCGYEDLREMAADISKLITVVDANLENKVLRAVMKDFTPNGFMQMMRTYNKEKQAPVPAQSAPEQVPDSDQGPAPAVKRDETKRDETVQGKILQEKIPQEENMRKGGAAFPLTEQKTKIPGEIFINIPMNGNHIRKKDAGKKEEKARAGETHEPKKTKKIGDFLGIGKETQCEAMPVAVMERNITKPESQHDINFEQFEDSTEDTVFIREKTRVTGFRLVSAALLPPVIDVPIREGEVFTIGRYDAAAGRKQSSFEFDKKAKAISRRHSAVERNAGGYSIVDLSSSAGTFVDGQKLQVNIPYDLEQGARVSFGNAGADYIWEA